MRIAILGTGAIGGVLAGCLSDTNAELVCVSRGRTARDLLEGLTLLESLVQLPSWHLSLKI